MRRAARARARRTARLEQVPALLAHRPREPHAAGAAVCVARNPGCPARRRLYTVSLMTLADDLSATEAEAVELTARDTCGQGVAPSTPTGWTRAEQDAGVAADGRGELQLSPEHVLLLRSTRTTSRIWERSSWPAMRARGRCSGIRAWASPDPSRARHVPKDEAEFPRGVRVASERDRRVSAGKSVSHDPAIHRSFQIRQLPEAFKPTSPGGFMNAPGVYDKDPGGFFYIPTTTRKAATSISAQRSKIRGRSSATRAFLDTFCRFSIANQLRTRSGASRETAYSREGWACMEKKC